MFVHFLLVFDLLFVLFRIALWSSVGKELSPWLLICAVFYFSAILVVHIGVWGRVWNSIVSVPDHCFCIYLVTLQTSTECTAMAESIYVQTD